MRADAVDGAQREQLPSGSVVRQRRDATCGTSAAVSGVSLIGALRIASSVQRASGTRRARPADVHPQLAVRVDADLVTRRRTRWSRAARTPQAQSSCGRRLAVRRSRWRVVCGRTAVSLIGGSPSTRARTADRALDDRPSLAVGVEPSRLIAASVARCRHGRADLQLQPRRSRVVGLGGVEGGEARASSRSRHRARWSPQQRTSPDQRQRTCMPTQLGGPHLARSAAISSGLRGSVRGSVIETVLQQ